VTVLVHPELGPGLLASLQRGGSINLHVISPVCVSGWTNSTCRGLPAVLVNPTRSDALIVTSLGSSLVAPMMTVVRGVVPAAGTEWLRPEQPASAGRQSQPASMRFHDLVIDVPFPVVRRTRWLSLAA
jgi:hypothetical protein